MAHLPASSVERARDYDYTHPERYYKGLTLAVEGESEDIYWERRREGIRGGREPDADWPEEELCWSCGWTSYMESTSSYGSRVKIMHTRESIGIWSIGSKWLLRDQPNDGTLGNDYMTQQFLRAQPGLKIPLVKEIRSLSNGTDAIYFTLMSRAQGGDLTPEQKSSYKDQLADVIRELRQFTAPFPQKVDGSPLNDVLIGFCGRRHPPTCGTIGRTTEEWLDSIGAELRRGLSRVHKTEDPVILESKLQELKDNFPNPEPYVLTHGDLNLTNIIVKDGRIEAILDWEMAGYYPWWVEHWASLMGSNRYNEDMYESLWEDFSPEHEAPVFHKEVNLKVGQVLMAWGNAQSDIVHPGSMTALLRPAFCKCKPYAGLFTLLSRGLRYEHILGERREILAAERRRKMRALYNPDAIDVRVDEKGT